MQVVIFINATKKIVRNRAPPFSKMWIIAATGFRQNECTIKKKTEVSCMKPRLFTFSYIDCPALTLQHTFLNGLSLVSIRSNRRKFSRNLQTQLSYLEPCGSACLCQRPLNIFIRKRFPAPSKQTHQKNIPSTL